jgi:hypothetical protein
VASEEETIRTETRESAGRRSGVDAQGAESATELGATERIFSNLTTELADRAAQRNLFENGAREQGERFSRISSKSRPSSANWQTPTPATSVRLPQPWKVAQVALTEAEAAAVAA